MIERMISREDACERLNILAKEAKENGAEKTQKLFEDFSANRISAQELVEQVEKAMKAWDRRVSEFSKIRMSL